MIYANIQNYTHVLFYPDLINKYYIITGKKSIFNL